MKEVVGIQRIVSEKKGNHTSNTAMLKEILLSSILQLMAKLC